MTIPVFPRHPSILLSGYTVTPVPNIRRTEFENGMVRQARNATRQMIERDVTLNCCDIMCYALVKNFIDRDTAGGALWFMWHCPDRAAQGLSNPIRVRIKGGARKFTPQNVEMTSWNCQLTLEGWNNQ